MGDEELLEVGLEENQSDAGLQDREMEQQEEAADGLDVVGQQNVANPQAPAAENAPIGEIRQEITNSGGAGGNESRDPNYQDMIRGLEDLAQRLRQPVPAASADQIRTAGELRADCAAICTNADAYIRSHKFSVSKAARSRRRHAQEVSRKCRNDAMNLYVIMKNTAIQGQTTWGQLLDQRSGRIPQQPAGTDAQIEAQVQAAGMQFPKAESATDFEKWGLLLETSERGGIGTGNSKYFDRVQEGLREVSHALQGRFDDLINDNIKMLGTASNAFQSLLEACVSYTARKPRTEKGKVRKRIVEKLKEYAEQDIKGCSNAMDAFFGMSQEEMAAETWETVLRSARSVKISVRDFSRLEGAGGGASSEVVKLQTETGTKYFKREDSIDLDEVRDETDKPLAIAKKEMFERFGNVPEADVSLLPDLLTLPDGDPTFQDVSEEGRPAITYCYKRYRQIKTNFEDLYENLGFLDEGGVVNMSRRNVATSRMASLLGLEELIAKSQTVDITDEATGRLIRGNLMDQAEGIEYANVWEDLINGRVTSSFLRDVTNLQVLDVLCGQLDRHGGNMMYKVENGNITGVQGIDNDAAFGTNVDVASTLDAFRKDCKVFDIDGETMILPYMDAKLAERILALDGNMLRYILHDLVKEEEVNAAVKRLNIMKKGIRINMEKEPDRFLNEEREWTLIDDEQDRLDLVRYFNYTNLLEEEKKDPEKAAANKQKSVQYNMIRSQRANRDILAEEPEKKENRKEMAKEVYGKGDPEFLSILLSYIEDPQNTGKDMSAVELNKYRDADMQLKELLRRKYRGRDNYVAFLTTLG